MSVEKSIVSKLLEAYTRLDYMKMEDDELVGLARNRDKKAEEVLIQRYEKLIRHIGKGFFMKGGDADDLQQEGLLGFVSAIKDYVPGKNKNFKNFAMLAAKRSMTDAVRKSSSKKASMVSDADDYDNMDTRIPTGKRDNPLDVVIDKQSQARIQDYMKKNLTDWEKSVLSLYLKGMTYPQIASKLGKTRKAVDNAMQQIRKKMTVYRNTIKDSKLISIVESIINDDRARLREAYMYMFE